MATRELLFGTEKFFLVFKFPISKLGKYLEVTNQDAYFSGVGIGRTSIGILRKPKTTP